MKAIYYEDYGDAEQLKFGDQPDPKVGKDDVLIRVNAASVNPIDWKLRAGEIKMATVFRFPIIPGRDVAGEVIEVGANVKRLKVGDKVFGMLDSVGGGYAELASIPASLAQPIPEHMTFDEAAAVPLVSMTALQALRDKGELQAGETVLINGAAGAVGMMAVQLAKALGASEVVAVCSRKHFELVRSLGADKLMDQHEQDFTKAHDAYDIIFDAVGKSTYSACKPALKHDGRYVTTLPDPKQAVDFIASLFTEKKLKPMLAKDKAEDIAFIKELLEAKKIKTLVARTYPLSQAAQAQKDSEAGGFEGKLVLRVD